MKLKISPLRITITFSLAALFAAGALFGICYNFFLTWPWDWKPYVVIAFWLISSIAFYVWTLKRNYYILNRKYVEVKRFGKSLIYYFSDIIYIDEEKSEKKKTIYFYTRQGHMRYLTFDSKGLLYKAMLEKCSNRLNKEEFTQRYPDVKF